MNTTDFGQLIKAHPEILDSPKTFAAFLRDIYSTEKGNVNLMITTYNAGVVSMLRSSALDSLLTSRIMTLLMDDYSISKERARWAAELWISAYAFSMGRVEPQRMAATPSQTSARPAVQRTSSGGSGRDRKRVADFFTKIVGVTHNNTGANTENRQVIIQDLKSRGQLEPGQALTLELDTENRWSENAVKVIAPDGRQLGYLSQAVVDKNAPQMRDGYEYQAFVSAVTGGTDGYVYGVNIRIVVYPPTTNSGAPEPTQMKKPEVSVVSPVHKASSAPKPITSAPSTLPPALVAETDPNHFEVKDKDSGCVITKYVGPEISQIDIPICIDGKYITEIGENAFRNCNSLTKVSIPDGIIIIGWGAFSGCRNLSSVIIPGSVTQIWGCAFEDCTSLTSLEVRANAIHIWPNVFKGTQWLKDAGEFAIVNHILLAYQGNGGHVVIPKDISKIEWGTFEGHIGLTSVAIPDSVKEIEMSAFKGCTCLTDVSIQKSTTEIAYDAFEDTPWLKSLGEFAIINHILLAYHGCGGDVVIPEDVIEISDYAFRNRPQCITTVTIPRKVKEIGVRAFENCWNLTYVTIPNSITTIGGFAFSGCRSLASVTIPDSITEIKWCTFSGCESLTSIIIPNSVVTIGRGAFKGCTSLINVTISKNVIEIGQGAFEQCTHLSSVVIPEGVTKIEDRTFSWCLSLANMILPSSVTEISKNAFHKCTHLVIYASIGSYAEQYARENKIPFSAI